MNASTIATKPPDDARILKLEEVAYVLRVSPTSVRNLVSRGKLPTVPLTVSGVHRGVLRTDLDGYIAAGRSREPGGGEAVSAKPAVRSSLVKAGWEGYDPLGTTPVNPSREKKV